MHSSGFARMMLFARLRQPGGRRAKPKARGHNDELESQTSPRNTHCIGNVVAYICCSTRKCAPRRATGSVSGNRRSVGDLRSAVRETKIGSSVRVSGDQNPLRSHAPAESSHAWVVQARSSLRTSRSVDWRDFTHTRNNDHARRRRIHPKVNLWHPGPCRSAGHGLWRGGCHHLLPNPLHQFEWTLILKGMASGEGI